MSIRIVICICIIACSACTSLKESAAAYFLLSKPIAGVENPNHIIERIKGTASIRKLIYPHVKSEKILHCSILRNQLYVAALKGTNKEMGKEIGDATIALERAYQTDDDSFLAICAQIFASELGKSFWQIALNYITITE